MDSVTGSDDEQMSESGKRLTVQLMDKKKNKKSSPSDEVDRYVDHPLNNNQQYQNPLTFWQQKSNQIWFPNLFRLARQYFYVPCSSAAVERQFSAAGQPITQRRSCLDPSTMNKIFFCDQLQKTRIIIVEFFPVGVIYIAYQTNSICMQQ